MEERLQVVPKPLASISIPLQQQDLKQEPALVSRAAEKSVVLRMSYSKEEPRDNNGTCPAGPASSPIWVNDSSELPEEYIQQMRNLSLTSQPQSDSSVLSRDDKYEATANDVYVTATASEGQRSQEEKTASSKARPKGVIIRCPICMDFYSQILKSKRLLMSTWCGHIFCSRCLTAAFEVTRACPTCSRDLTYRPYHPIYI